MEEDDFSTNLTSYFNGLFLVVLLMGFLAMIIIIAVLLK